MSFFALKALEVKPRFTLKIRDQKIICYLSVSYIPWEDQVTILHINSSGIAFSLPQVLKPLAGELIELEFSYGEKYIGRVIHVQDLSADHTGVVIQFLTSSSSENTTLMSKLINEIKFGSHFKSKITWIRYFSLGLLMSLFFLLAMIITSLIIKFF